MWESFRNGKDNCGVSKYNALINKDHKLSRIYIGGIIWGTAVIDDENNIYVGSSNRLFICIGIDNIIKWNYKLSRVTDSLIDSAAVLYKSLIIIPGGDGIVHALNKYNGNLEWQFIPEIDNLNNKKYKKDMIVNSFEGNIQIDSNGRIYIGCDNDFYYCINANNGKLIWSFKTNMMIWSCGCLINNEKNIVFGSLDRYIYMLDTSSGKLVDKYKTNAEIKSSPLTFDDKLIICNSNGEVYCFDISDERFNLLWMNNYETEIYSSPAYKNNILIIAKMNGEIIAINVTNNSQIWLFKIAGTFCSSPIISLNNIVLIGSSEGKLYSFYLNANVDKINLIGYFDINIFYNKNDIYYRKNLNASPTIDINGNIHIGGYDGYIYTIPSNLCKKKLKKQNNKSYLKLIHKKLIIQYKVNINSESESEAVALSYINCKEKIPYDIVISSDGKYINFIPKFCFGLDQTYKINLYGKYFRQSNRWWKDRLNLFGERNFKTTIELPKIEYKSTVLDDAKSDSIICWNVWDFFSTQPRVLDTYIPAAMNAIGYTIIGFGFHKKEGDLKTYFKMLLLPCNPSIDNEEFLFIHDTNKILIIDAFYFSGIILTTCKEKFELSVMGGTLPFTSFNTFMNIDNKDLSLDCDFYNVASALNVKGNGKKYNFSSDIINQLCDYSMKIKSVGSFKGKYIELKTQYKNNVYIDNNLIIIKFDSELIRINKIITIIEFDYNNHTIKYIYESINNKTLLHKISYKYNYLILLNNIVLKLFIKI